MLYSFLTAIMIFVSLLIILLIMICVDFPVDLSCALTSPMPGKHDDEAVVVAVDVCGTKLGLELLLRGLTTATLWQ